MKPITQAIIVTKIGKTQTARNNFRVRELIGVTDEVGERQFLKIRFIGDNGSILDSVTPGDKLLATFRIVGRAWDNPGTQEQEIFISLEAIGLTRHDGTPLTKRVESIYDMPY